MMMMVVVMVVAMVIVMVVMVNQKEKVETSSIKSSTSALVGQYWDYMLVVIKNPTF